MDDQRIIPGMTMLAVSKMGLFDGIGSNDSGNSLNIDSGKLANFLTNVDDSYKKDIPYHN